MSSFQCPGCGLDAPLSEPCPRCEMLFHPDGPVMQLCMVSKRLAATRDALIKALDDLQATEKQALAYKAAAYAENRGLTAMYREALKRLNAMGDALRRRPCEKLWTALELAHQRMVEYHDMARTLSQLETPVADMTPGGPIKIRAER